MGKLKKVFTNLLKGASFATRVHAGQARKGKPQVPYITHPLTVALVLSHIGAAEEVVVAGILHDTIEDSPEGNKVTKNILTKEFGPEVAELVDAVTEQNKNLPWEERKRAAIEHIATMGHNAQLLKSADLLVNLTDLVNDLEEHGLDYMKHFNAPLPAQRRRYSQAVEELVKAWPQNPLLPQLKNMLDTLFTF